MSKISYCFVEPLDVLLLRGNKHFGEPGSYGEALMPPWPSVAAGALRSRMLADDGVDISDFAAGRITHPSLGSPLKPGPFTITGFHLARRYADGTVEALFALPADLTIIGDDTGKPAAIRELRPTQVTAGLFLSSMPIARLPVLAEQKRSKPVSGYWLNEKGWKKYLAGRLPEIADIVSSSQLWSIDQRVGVGLDATTRRAAEGRLFSVQAVAFKQQVLLADREYNTGFLVGVAGAELPKSGSLRMGGDGRSAVIHQAAVNASVFEPDYEAIVRSGRCRLVLTSPGILPEGWLPIGAAKTGENEYTFSLRSIKARLVCAAVPRAEVISGWNLAEEKPKPALRAAPVGSVYWLEDLVASPASLKALVSSGLWSEECEDPVRRAEGFNRFTLAEYK